MKISHETPRCLLEQSKKFNDYQYALPHLLEADEIYRNHFLQCRDEGIEIYLDNSLHELGASLNNDILLKWINILKPSNFFIPDVWEDQEQSIKNAIEWSTIETPNETTKVAIVQAKSFEEAKHCYQEYKRLGYKKVAFSYGASYYNYISGNGGDYGKAFGRYLLIKEFYNKNIFDKGDRIHLLGCSLPQEFGWYNRLDFSIESIDTSNPVMAAIEGWRYTENGLKLKPKLNMNITFETPFNLVNGDLIHYNVKQFRKINKL